MKSVVTHTVARVAIFIILVMAVGLLVRGHDAPGGGFLAGLLTAGAAVLARFAYGRRAYETFLMGTPLQVAAGGLLVAVLSFLPALLDGNPAGKGIWASANLGHLGQPKVGTPILFDLGVMLIVVGMANGIMTLVLPEDAGEDSP